MYCSNTVFEGPDLHNPHPPDNPHSDQPFGLLEYYNCRCSFGRPGKFQAVRAHIAHHDDYNSDHKDNHSRRCRDNHRFDIARHQRQAWSLRYQLVASLPHRAGSHHRCLELNSRCLEPQNPHQRRRHSSCLNFDTSLGNIPLRLSSPNPQRSSYPCGLEDHRKH